jgi:hypothetical protein
LDLEQFCRRDVEKLVGFARRQAEFVQHPACGLRGHFTLGHPYARAALDRSFVEVGCGRGHGVDAGGFGASAGFAPNHHVAGIAAEGLDVALRPVECGDNVEHAGIRAVDILFTKYVGQEQVTHDAEAVVGLHHDDIVFAGQVGALLEEARAGAGGETAAMAIEHHRSLAAIIDGWRPYVEYEAVLVRLWLVGAHGAVWRLYGRMAPDQRVLHALPFFQWRGCFESRVTDGGGGVSHAAEDADAVLFLAAEAALHGVNFYKLGGLCAHQRGGREQPQSGGPQEHGTAIEREVVRLHLLTSLELPGAARA